MKVPALPAYERLGRLVFMLLHNQRGYTKQQVFQYLVQYYPLDPKTLGTVNREKQFDRDRRSLADQGIIVETVRDEYGLEEDLYRYRIDQKDFRFPSDLVFTPEEISLLDLAAQTWKGSELSAVSSSGMHRIRNFDSSSPDPVIGITPSLNIPVKTYQGLQDAINETQAISFPYLKVLAKAPELRRVEPIVIVQFHGEWLLYAFDLDRNDFRNFRLDRIAAGGIKQLKMLAEHRLDDARASALHKLQHYFDGNIARVRVVSGSLAEKSLAARAIHADSEVESRLDTAAHKQPGYEQSTVDSAVHEQAGDDSAVQEYVEFVLNFLDTDSFATELRYFGPDVTVLSPETLRESVLHGLKNALKIHTLNQNDQQNGATHE